ncbi:hypothetical protein ACQ4PT_049712 [Festuca glaucescens]
MGTPARDPSDAVAPLHGPQPAASTILTAQILHTSGFSAAKSAALHALSDITCRYITSLGRTAVAIAEARGRTEPNLLDLILSFEDHALVGFLGASDPTRPVLHSGVLLELVGFAHLVREVQFMKLRPRMGGWDSHRKGWESFAAAGKEPPLKHVPRWLPCFPEEQEAKLEAKNEDETKARWEVRRVVEVEAEQMSMVNGHCMEGRGAVPEKRGKVQFLMYGKKRRWESKSAMQEHYGASGYFSEANGSQKKEHLEKVKLTEVSVSDKLEGFRAEKEYLDGTTDITRTVHFGKPSEHEKSCYTAVLKGHIALDAAVFPNGTTGHSLDILARTPLWKNGLDYRHGTGHGVGSYLNVHEGPHLISFRPSARNVPLQASMTVTDGQ